MAGDWIKVELVTPDKPEVDEMAEFLGVTRNEVLGGLVRLWVWADQQSIDGNAIRVTSVTLMKRCQVDNFAEALRKVGWLVGEEMNFTLPNFERHNGESAKKRALTAKRVAKFRNAKVTQQSLPEKRREEKKVTTGMCESREELPTSTPKDQVSSSNGDRGAAERVLEFLNERAHRDFRPTDVNLDFIVARLKEGYTEGQCRQVIAKKIREWGEDDMMAKFIRPATLFNREKFNQYAGELVIEEGAT